MPDCFPAAGNIRIIQFSIGRHAMYFLTDPQRYISEMERFLSESSVQTELDKYRK